MVAVEGVLHSRLVSSLFNFLMALSYLSIQSRTSLLLAGELNESEDVHSSIWKSQHRRTDSQLGNDVLLADALATISTLLICPKPPKNLISCSWVTVGGRLPTNIVQSSVTLRSTDI